MAEETIRLTIPSLDEEDVSAVADVIRSGFLVQGAKVREFEEAFAAYVGTAHCVAVPNCTEALFLALLALGVGKGDEVAVCTYSWPTTANVIALVGAVPVFVDVDPDTFNIDPAKLEAALAAHPKVKAVLPVHTFGGSADIVRICAIAKAAGVPVIEDAACALGTEQGGRRAGAFGIVGCFSLHPRKAITTGEGGMITTDDAKLAKLLRMLRNHGQDPDAPAPDFVMPGHNLRMTEFQAALGLSQMKKLERIIESRIARAQIYDRLFEGTAVRAPRALTGSRHVYQSYVVLLPPSAPRAAIIAELKAEGIETTIGTYHMPLTTYFRTTFHGKPGDYPITDDIAGRALTLPLYETLSLSSQERVVERLLSALARSR
jgi:perosamine synthetase